MKRILSVMALLLALAVLPAVVLGANTFISDAANVMENSQVSELETRCEALAEEYDVGVYLCTVDAYTGGSIREFAKDYYRDNALGLGEANRGILFVVATSQREYVTVTYGWADALSECPFTDYGVERLEEEIVSYISQDDYAGGFTAYVDECEYYLAYLAGNGEPFDVGSDSGSRMDNVKAGLPYAIVIGLVVAGVIVMIMKKKTTGGMDAPLATVYVNRDSFVGNGGNDRFLYTTETVRTIESKSNGGGGSSVDSDGFGGSSGGSY